MEKSKNQLKREAKAKRRLETRSEWLQQIKQKRKERKEKRKEQGLPTHNRKKIEQLEKRFNICIDIIPDLMNEREQKSLSRQIGKCYAANNRIRQPCNLILSNLNDFPLNSENWKCKILNDSILNSEDTKKLVYLTADSENILEELNEEDVYIIGGLVDKNRHKGLCKELAIKNEIRHAQLPISQHLRLIGSRILTVNQVFDILLDKIGGKEWKDCFESIPQRKITSELKKDKE